MNYPILWLSLWRQGHTSPVVVESLVVEDVEGEARPGAEEAVVHVAYVPITQRKRIEPSSNVQKAQSDPTKPSRNAPIFTSARTKLANTTSTIAFPEINQKPVQEDMRVESVSSNRGFSVENNQERSARSMKRETQLFGNIENKKNTIGKMEHPAKKKENSNSYDDCTTSIRPVIESKITEKKSSANMEDARSKGDCCMTTVPRPESSSAFSKDVNDVSETPVDTFKTANASTTAIIEETKHVNSKPMVSGGLTGGIQQGLRTRNNHGGSARVMSTRKMMTYDEKLHKLQKRDPTMPGPDKGIVWPKSMDSLSKIDAAYYVEQFLRSELFRQRCLRKLQGSKSWMNGLSQFQVWVLEHEEKDELQEVLHPIKSQTNNAKAKVVCWRGKTPPPPPREE